jgi:cytochrome c oxidase cbb3-type subunit 4
MNTYSFLRQLADSWMLLFLFCFFVGVLLWVVRPANNKKYSDAAMIPSRNEEKPAIKLKVP